MADENRLLSGSGLNEYNYGNKIFPDGEKRIPDKKAIKVSRHFDINDGANNLNGGTPYENNQLVPKQDLIRYNIFQIIDYNVADEGDEKFYIVGEIRFGIPGVGTTPPYDYINGEGIRLTKEQWDYETRRIASMAPRGVINNSDKYAVKLSLKGETFPLLPVTYIFGKNLNDLGSGKSVFVNIFKVPITITISCPEMMDALLNPVPPILKDFKVEFINSGGNVIYTHSLFKDDFNFYTQNPMTSSISDTSTFQKNDSCPEYEEVRYLKVYTPFDPNPSGGIIIDNSIYKISKIKYRGNDYAPDQNLEYCMIDLNDFYLSAPEEKMLTTGRSIIIEGIKEESTPSPSPTKYYETVSMRLKLYQEFTDHSLSYFEKVTLMSGNATMTYTGGTIDGETKKDVNFTLGNFTGSNEGSEREFISYDEIYYKYKNYSMKLDINGTFRLQSRVPGPGYSCRVLVSKTPGFEDYNTEEASVTLYGENINFSLSTQLEFSQKIESVSRYVYIKFIE